VNFVYIMFLRLGEIDESERERERLIRYEMRGEEANCFVYFYIVSNIF
jgi:hypothetical protein